MNNKTGKILMTSVIVFLATLLFSAERALAAEFLMSGSNETNVGTPFEFSVSLNTSGQTLNAVSGEVVFPTDLLEFDSIKDGNSIVNFWVEAPRAENGKIIFSGIVPGGYAGDNGWLFSVIFVPKKIGNGEIAFAKKLALLNDGKGSEAEVSAAAWPLIIISADPNASTPSVVVDIIPPEPFTPEISTMPEIFNGAYFLAFITQDKGSGIDHYEVREARAALVGSGAWIKATSPYQLIDQELKSSIQVKAVDKAGNVRIAALAPARPLSWYEKLCPWCIIIVISVIFLVVISWRIIAHRKN